MSSADEIYKALEAADAASEDPSLSDEERAEAARDATQLAIKYQEAKNAAPAPAPGASEGFPSALPHASTTRDFLDVAREDGVVNAISGHPAYSAVQGVADLPLGAAQLAANVTGIGDEGMNKFMQRRESMMQEGRDTYGREGFDWWRLGGAVGGGGVAGKGINMGKTLGEQMLKGGGVGAGFGAIAPVTDEDYDKTKAEQLLVSTLLGAGTPAAIAGAKELGKAGKQVWQTIQPYFSDPRKTFVDYLRRELGDKFDTVVDLARTNKQPVGNQTLGEVASPAGSTKLSALQVAAKKQGGDDYAAQAAAQREAEEEVLRQVGGTEDDLANAITRRAKATDDMREAVIGNPDKGLKGEAQKNTEKYVEALARREELGAPATGTTAVVTPGGPAGYGYLPNATTKVTAQDRGKYGEAVRSVADANKGVGEVVRDTSRATRDQHNVSTVWGAKIPARYTPHRNMLETSEEFLDDAKFIEAAKKFDLEEAESLIATMDAYGVRPLTTKAVVSGLAKVRDNPNTGSAAQQIIGKIIKAVERESQGGMIDPVRLYRMRKLDLQQAVERMFGKEGAQQYQGKLVSDAQHALDDAIEAASGGGWKAYLQKFSEMSRDVDKMRAVQSLRLKRPEETSAVVRAESFRKDVENLPRDTGAKDLPSLLRGSGTWRQGRSAERNLARLEEGLDRSRTMENLAKHNDGSIDMWLIDAPHILYRPFVIINSILSKLGSTQVEAVKKAGEKMMLADPEKGFVEFLMMVEKTNPGVVNKAASEVANQQGAVIGGGATGLAEVLRNGT